MAKKILLIDDDALVLKSVKNILERQKYEVLTAKSCDEALKAVSSQPIDLIISDIRMPGKDGLETARLLKEKLHSSGRQEIPFIFITGYASEEAPIEAVKLGAKDYLLKPFDVDELMGSVKKHLGQD